MDGSSIDLIRGNWDVIGRLLAAMVAGFVLGVNRDLRGKAAGVRTHGLVAIGSSLVTIISIEVASVAQYDPNAIARVVQGIITGIGFIGGGVILKVPEHRTVQGLTTAASVWISACLGIAFGAGMWRSAVFGLALTMAALLVGGAIEEIAARIFKSRDGDGHANARSGGR